MTALRDAILNLSPFLYWPLDELVGTTANDLSGNGHNGTYTLQVNRGDVPVPGDFPNPAINFNGQNIATPTRAVQIAGLADPGVQTFVLHFWNDVSNFPASEVPFGWTSNSTNGYIIQFNGTSQLLDAQIGTAGGYVQINDPQNLTEFAPHWNQVVLVVDSTVPIMSLYVNGALRGQSTYTLHTTPPGTSLTLGSLNQTGGPAQGYTGHVAHFAIIHSALTFAQVLDLYNAAGIAPVYQGNVTTAALAGTSPTSYALGTASAGLTGSGTIAVPQLYGVWVEITAHPAGWGHTADSPQRFIPTFGQIQFSDLNGDSDGFQIHYLTELIFAPNRTNLFLRYSLRPGITATLHPLTLQ